MHSLFSEPSRRRFLLKTVTPIFAVAIAIAALVASLFLWAIHEADRISIERQHRLVEFVVSQLQTDIALDQESVTVWDDAVLALRDANEGNTANAEWIDLNLGSWMHTYFGHDGAYVLDPQNEPLYSFADGEIAPPSAYRALAPTAVPLVDALRKRQRAGDTEGVTGRIQSIGVSDIAVVSGRPAVVSVKPVVSDSGEIEQTPGEGFVHVAVRFLDGSFLDDLSTNYLLEGLRFAWRDDSADTEASAALRSANGETVGHVVWEPYRPGSTVMSRTGPATVGFFMVVMAALALLVLALRRRSLRLSQSEAQVRYLAHHDVLTGLANRGWFDSELARTLKELEATGETIAVLYLDLDRFKEVNDTFGHPAGDELLQEFANRLRQLTSQDDLVSRVGGDEFLVMLRNPASPSAVDEFCKRMIELARHPFALSDTQVFVSVSIGIAFAPRDGLEPAELARRADVAMYNAKRSGRSAFSVYDRAMDSATLARRNLERDLRGALKMPGQLQLHYQPLFSADDRVTGVEALVRWYHPERGMIMPSVFIPVAEDSGLIEELGNWVLQEACTTAASWPIETLAVNVSPLELYNPGYSVRVANTLLSTGMSPHRLELELTESALSDQNGACANNLAALRQLGVRLALDDFGTGFSSLSRLQQITVDRVKIDRSFVSGFGSSNGDEAIVRAIVNLAHAIGLKTTAEGVETHLQSQFLKDIGCDELQGFLLSLPLPASEVTRLWTEQAADISSR